MDFHNQGCLLNFDFFFSYFEPEMSTSVALTWTKLLHFISIYFLKVFYRWVCSYIIHSLIYITNYCKRYGRNGSIKLLLTEFSDLWTNWEIHPLFPLLTLICPEKNTNILNVALSNDQISVFKMCANMVYIWLITNSYRMFKHDTSENL